MKRLTKNTSSLWLPDYISSDVSNIDFNHLKGLGIKACFFDLDHTLLVHGTVNMDKKTVAILRATNLDLYIATNRRFSPELDDIAKQMGAKGVMHAKSKRIAKPAITYYEQAMSLTGLKPNQMTMVGDRLVQDVFGAKRAGLTSVMVQKFGKVKWYDQVISLLDRLLPVVFAKHYKEI